MSPSILVVGSTGNTGAEVVRALPGLLANSSTLANHRIIALTRNAQGKVAKELSECPSVTVIEKNWVDIDAEWLRENEVQRLYSACHNEGTQFIDESTLYNAVREAGVEYAVRLSTTHESVSADNLVPYGRSHWAIETMLEQPAFDKLAWTSLQPMVFTPYVIGEAVAWLKNYRETGQQTKLSLMLGENKEVPAIDANEVGTIAAHLLASEDTPPHHRQKYILVGPESLTGRKIVDLVEKHAGTKVDDVEFSVVDGIDGLRNAGFADHTIKGLKRALRASLAESGSSPKRSAPTSPEILKLYAPRNSALKALDEALAAIPAGTL